MRLTVSLLNRFSAYFLQIIATLGQIDYIYGIAHINNNSILVFLFSDDEHSNRQPKRD